MSKLIKLPDNIINDYVENFRNQLSGVRMFNGKLEYEQSFELKDSENATLVISPVAFAKMTSLVMNYTSEVAWHGTSRKENGVYYIDDIIVYPQVVSGTTVNTDQEEYTQWLYSLDEDTFNHIRMQGHSHVNMTTSPSATDETHQQSILEQLDDDMYYIFLIMNKSMDMNFRIFDMKDNVLYERSDVNVYIGDASIDLLAFTNDAKDKVKTKTYTAGFAPTASGTKYKKNKKKDNTTTYYSSGYLYDDFDWSKYY